jgi:hypothetical protein
MGYQWVFVDGPIERRREYCKWLVKRLDENIGLFQQFEINE